MMEADLFESLFEMYDRVQPGLMKDIMSKEITKEEKCVLYKLELLWFVLKQTSDLKKFHKSQVYIQQHKKNSRRHMLTITSTQN